MRIDYKKEFIKRLRGGQYTQAKGLLRSVMNPKKFCALGVLCDIISDDWEITPNGAWFTWNGQTAMIPRRFDDIISWEEQQLIQYWNDFEKLSFTEIANKIEKELD